MNGQAYFTNWSMPTLVNRQAMYISMPIGGVSPRRSAACASDRAWEGTLLDKYYFARRPSHSKRRKARSVSPGLLLCRAGRSGTPLHPSGNGAECPNLVERTGHK
jgi:hypothetical protein